MKQTLFSGVCTALVTPFKDGNINFSLLEVLLERQIAAGIPTICLCGTTGEAPTLSDQEKLAMIRFAKTKVGDSCMILAGTGGNSTSHAVELSKAAVQAGADALLVVSPYYNKANAEGLIAHYCQICTSVPIPVVIYNVPSRTGLDIPVPVYQELAKLPNVAGVKEASCDMRKVAQIRMQCPGDFTVWSGNDDLILPTAALGCKGVVSVISNVEPLLTQTMTQAAMDGDLDTALNLQKKLWPLLQALSCDINPIPVKAAMKVIGYDCGQCRLPLTDLPAEKIKFLKEGIFALQ